MGKVLLLPSKVVQKKYLGSDKTVYGYISGLNLENEAGISPQVPATLEITTNKASRRVREVEPLGGWREVVLRAPRTQVTSENVDALRFLDLITRVSPNMLDELELDNLRDFARTLDRKLLYECAQYYPAKTSKRLIESEAFGVLA